MKTIKLWTINILCLVCFSPSIQAQAVNLYIGLSQTKNSSTLVTPADLRHPGYVLGLDAMLSKYGLDIIGGLRYHRFSFDAVSDSDYFTDNDHISYVQVRFGLNGNHKISEYFSLRAFFMAGGNMIVNLPSGRTNDPHSNLRDAFFNLSGGAGITVSVFSLMLEYEKGITDGANDLMDSKFNTTSLVLGVMF